MGDPRQRGPTNIMLNYRLAYLVEEAVRNTGHNAQSAPLAYKLRGNNHEGLTEVAPACLQHDGEHLGPVACDLGVECNAIQPVPLRMGGACRDAVATDMEVGEFARRKVGGEASAGSLALIVIREAD